MALQGNMLALDSLDSSHLDTQVLQLVLQLEVLLHIKCQVHHQQQLGHPR